MKKVKFKSAIAKMMVLCGLLACVFLIEGCGSGYEMTESNGRVYVQKKSWWKTMFFGR